MDRDQLNEHLKFAAELGVTGVSRDPAWRARADGARSRAQTASRDISAAQASSQSMSTSDAPGVPLTLSMNAAEALAAVRADIGDCTRCKLSTLGRNQIVFGVGNPHADLMFVGEAPGADED